MIRKEKRRFTLILFLHIFVYVGMFLSVRCRGSIGWIHVRNWHYFCLFSKIHGVILVAFWTEKCVLVTLGPSGLRITATGTKWRWSEIQSQLQPSILPHVALTFLEQLVAER